MVRPSTFSLASSSTLTQKAVCLNYKSSTQHNIIINVHRFSCDMSITLVWFNKNHDMLTNSGKNSECNLSWNSVPWEPLFRVGRWLDGQTWQGSQSLSAIASYLHLTTCDLFFQNHEIFKSWQVHFQSQLLKTPPPSSLPHKSDASVIPVCAQTCHVCFMDGLHTMRHLDTAACSILTLTFHPPISLQSPVTAWACAKHQGLLQV